MELSYFLLFCAVVATALAEVAVTRKCDEASDDLCSVSQVRIDPCKKKSRKICVLYQGNNVTMNFDFTPNFAAAKLKTEVYWDNGVNDIPFADMASSDGCTYTQCPTQTGVSQTLNYNLYLEPKLSKGSYLIKWKVWNEENKSQLCCFRTNIEIKKR